MSRKWKNWYQNDVENVKHNERSDQVLLERMMSVAEQE